MSHDTRIPEPVVPTLSLIIITKNEEASIERCLRSADFADEMIVVDSGSTDRTVDIAQACGARVVQTTDWPGFGAQKNRALDQARSEWVLSLDADEWLDAACAAQIKATLAKSANADAYRMPRRSRFCGQVVRHCGWSPDYVVRLFRRGQARFSDDLVHEALVVQGHIATLALPIDHVSIDTKADADDKIERYSSAAAKQMAARGRKATPLKASIRGWTAFAKTLIWRAGVLDGVTGWQVADYNRRYTDQKWRKLAALSKQRS